MDILGCLDGIDFDRSRLVYFWTLYDYCPSVVGYGMVFNTVETDSIQW